MNELEKLKKEFDEHCKKGCPESKYCIHCALEFMLSREQKLKSEAVKAIKELPLIKKESSNVG